MNLVEFQGCIGLIYGTLINIHKPLNYGAHKVWFNGQKKTWEKTTLCLLIIEVYSFTWTLGVQVFTMMSPFCANMSYIRIDIKFFYMMMNMLNTFWEILAT